MLFSVVSRSCWPESHLTGSVQNVPAPTFAGIEVRPVEPRGLGLVEHVGGDRLQRLVGQQTTRRPSCAARRACLGLLGAVLLAGDEVAQLQRVGVVVERRGEVAGRPAPSCRPRPWAGTRTAGVSVSSLAMTASGKPPLFGHEGRLLEQVAAGRVVEQRVAAGLEVRRDDRLGATADVAVGEGDLLEVLERRLDLRAVELQRTGDPLVVVVRAGETQDEVLDPVGDRPTGRLRRTRPRCTTASCPAALILSVRVSMLVERLRLGKAGRIEGRRRPSTRGS